jgi:hypothetical protein
MTGDHNQIQGVALAASIGGGESKEFAKPALGAIAEDGVSHSARGDNAETISFESIREPKERHVARGNASAAILDDGELRPVPQSCVAREPLSHGSRGRAAARPSSDLRKPPAADGLWRGAA